MAKDQKHASEADFLAALKENTNQAKGDAGRSRMVMTKPPEGPNRSLDEILAESAAVQHATDTAPDQVALPEAPIPVPTLADPPAVLPGGAADIPAFLQRPLASLAEPSAVVMLDVSKIRRSPFQVLTDLDTEVVDSIIDTVGNDPTKLINPIIVRRVGADAFELIAGEHRLEAFRASGLPQIPARIREVTDRDALVMLVVDNSNRRVLTDLETYLLAKQLEDAKVFRTRNEIAAALKKSKSMLSYIMMYSKLPQATLEFLQKRAIGLLSGTQVAQLVPLIESHPDAVDSSIRSLVQKGVSTATAAEVEREAKTFMTKKNGRPSKPSNGCILTDSRHQPVLRVRVTETRAEISVLKGSLDESKFQAFLQENMPKFLKNG